MEHLRVVHSDTINEEQYSTLIPESAIPVPAGISCCPLCNSNGPADSPVLLNHIAEHLHSFALRSLPWPGRESLHTNFDEQDDDDPDGLDDGDDDADNYFVYNDYFDQGSRSRPASTILPVAQIGTPTDCHRCTRARLLNDLQRHRTRGLKLRVTLVTLLITIRWLSLESHGQSLKIRIMTT